MWRGDAVGGWTRGAGSHDGPLDVDVPLSVSRSREADGDSERGCLSVTKAAFFVLAIPAVLRAAIRVRRSQGRLALDQQVDVLRRAPAFRVRWLARHPLWLAGSVERLLPVLPPHGHGPCLKRCLHLLDLWARCGLEPELRLGLLGEAAFREGHAWVVSRRDPRIRTPPLDYEEAFRF